MDETNKAATANDPVDFSGAWDALWTAQSLSPEAERLMTIAGGGLILYSIITFAWQRHRGRPDRGGRNNNGNGLAWTILIGCLLAAPEVIFPLLLTGVDTVANTVLNAMRSL